MKAYGCRLPLSAHAKLPISIVLGFTVKQSTYVFRRIQAKEYSISQRLLGLPAVPAQLPIGICSLFVL